MANSTADDNGSPPVDPQKTEEDLSFEIVQTLVKQPSYSAKIRYLASLGFKNRSISTILTELRGYPLSMQHVNNVLSNPLKSAQGRARQAEQSGGKPIELKPKLGRPKKDSDTRLTKQKLGAQPTPNPPKQEAEKPAEVISLLEQARRLKQQD